MLSAGLKLRSGPVAKPEARISGAGTSDFSNSSGDAALIRQAQTGRWEAFAELASHYDAAILALTLRLAGSEREARELCQKALLNAYRELRSYRFQCSFYLWIYRIVAATCIQFLHQTRDKIQTDKSTPFNVALRQLSPRERMVLELKHYFGLRLETIAIILETTEAVARNIFIRAILILRLECEECPSVKP